MTVDNTVTILCSDDGDVFSYSRTPASSVFTPYALALVRQYVDTCSRRKITLDLCRSQWPRGLRHVMSSSTQALGSWVRIPLEAWMSVQVYFVFVFSCIGSDLATRLIPHPRSPVYKSQVSE
jgi:hypothetical protein